MRSRTQGRFDPRLLEAIQERIRQLDATETRWLLLKYAERHPLTVLGLLHDLGELKAGGEFPADRRRGH